MARATRKHPQVGIGLQSPLSQQYLGKPGTRAVGGGVRTGAWMEDKKMQCREVQQQLNRLCDGERLSPAWLYPAVAGHCLTCAGCRAAWRRLQRLRRLSRRLPFGPVPPGLDARVLAALPETAPG